MTRPIRWLAPLGCLAVAACGGTADTSACGPAPGPVVAAVAQRLDVPGVLRFAQQVASPESGATFLSAELHEPDHDDDEDGDILTWAVDATGAGYVAVDVHAREASSWPAATFDVRREGAVDSRACTKKVRNDTDKDG